MYNETINGLSSVALVIIFGTIIYHWFYSNFKVAIPDHIVLGKVLEHEECVQDLNSNPKVSNVVRPINKPKKKKNKNKAKQKVKEQLRRDCYNAATSLGAKKKEADYLVQKVFSENKIKTVQDFIQKAYA